MHCCSPDGASEGLVTLSFQAAAAVGQEVVIFTAFNGSLSNGLARSSAFNYTDPTTGISQSQALIAANLEPVGARTMLPCFDAPRFKANYSMHLQVSQLLSLLSWCVCTLALLLALEHFTMSQQNCSTISVFSKVSAQIKVSHLQICEVVSK